VFWDPTVYVPREMPHPSESSTRKCLVVVVSDLFREERLNARDERRNGRRGGC
jgi:hypothetical protein